MLLTSNSFQSVRWIRRCGKLIIEKLCADVWLVGQVLLGRSPYLLDCQKVLIRDSFEGWKQIYLDEAGLLSGALAILFELADL